VEVVQACAEAGVRAVFVTKPLALRLAEADAMIETCRRHGALLVVAAHLNWDPWYEAARALFGGDSAGSTDGNAQRPEGPSGTPATPALGRLRSVVCHSSHPLSNIQSHTLCLFRRFVGAPVEWVVGEMDDPAAAATERDLSGSGYLAYANGARGFLNSHVGRAGMGWHLEFWGDRGWFTSLNAHATQEVWALLPGQREPARLQFPNPPAPAAQLDAGRRGCPGG
jgi:predicted dehydrogenase